MQVVSQGMKTAMSGRSGRQEVSWGVMMGVLMRDGNCGLPYLGVDVHASIFMKKSPKVDGS